MTEPQIDYVAVFQNIPIPALLLTPGFVIADVNLAYLRAAGRTRDCWAVTCSMRSLTTRRIPKRPG